MRRASVGRRAQRSRVRVRSRHPRKPGGTARATMGRWAHRNEQCLNWERTRRKFFREHADCTLTISLCVATGIERQCNQGCSKRSNSYWRDGRKCKRRLYRRVANRDASFPNQCSGGPCHGPGRYSQERYISQFHTHAFISSPTRAAGISSIAWGTIRLVEYPSCGTRLATSTRQRTRVGVLPASSSPLSPRRLSSPTARSR